MTVSTAMGAKEYCFHLHLLDHYLSLFAGVPVDLYSSSAADLKDLHYEDFFAWLAKCGQQCHPQLVAQGVRLLDSVEFSVATARMVH